MNVMHLLDPTITREGDQLFAQATGQGKAPIYAESDRRFFYKVVDAQITFTVQNGASMPAKRVQ